MSPISRVAVTTIILWLFFTRCIISCPNKSFKFGADYKKEFTLDGGKVYYVAIGSKQDGRWGIGVVHPLPNKGDVAYNTFSCTRESLGVGAPYARQKKTGFLGSKSRITHTICCYVPVNDILSEDELGKISDVFGILPDKIIKDVADMTKQTHSGKDGLKPLTKVPKESQKDTYYWYQPLSAKVVDRYLALILPKKYSGDLPIEYDQSECVFCVLTPTKFSVDWKKAIPTFRVEEDDNFKCQQPGQQECDTGITGELVGFIYDTQPGSTRISFGYSEDGNFDLVKLLPDLRRAYRSNHPDVYYFPLTAWFLDAGQEEPRFGAYGGWLLGSSCASCPSTSMKITINEAEAKMNKERFEHALSLGFGLGTGKAAPASVSGSVGYTYKNIKESSATLTSGRSTTITGVCNGFYMYYWGISIGSWGGSSSDKVPTQRFYCTDWPKMPMCLPRVQGMTAGTGNLDITTDDVEIVCRGDDNIKDFCGKAQTEGTTAPQVAYTKCKSLKPAKGNDEASYTWWPLHEGRPKPIRVIGQNDGEKILKTGSGSAHYINAGDELTDSRYANKKGLFDGNVVYDDTGEIIYSYNNRKELDDVMNQRQYFYDNTANPYGGSELLRAVMIALDVSSICIIAVICCICGGIAGYNSYKFRKIISEEN